VEIDPGGGGAAPAPPVPNINQALANLQSGNGTIADQATVMSGSATNLVAAAGTGFKLDPEAATALIASCDESLRVLDGLTGDLIQVREAPKLGGTRGARTVSSFTQKVASDPQGIAAAVVSLKGTITQMRQAYLKAVANYQAIEQQVTDSVNKLAQEVKQENAPAPQHGRIRAE
jgi:hypothetical protein